MPHAKSLLPWIMPLFVLSGACSDGDATFTATVPYQLGAGMTCAQAQVTTIRASLGPLRDQRFEAPCDGSNQLTLDGVQEGKWPLFVEALDAQGAVTMSSTVTAAAPVIEFKEDAVVTPRMTLASLPAKVFLRWDLGFGDCTSMGLKGFNVQAWDPSKGRLLMSGIIDCNAPVDEQLYRALPDPQGQLVGSELSALTVQAMLADGKAFGAPMTIELAAPPGPGYVVRASFKCSSESGGCVANPQSVSVGKE